MLFKTLTSIKIGELIPLPNIINIGLEIQSFKYTLQISILELEKALIADVKLSKSFVLIENSSKNILIFSKPKTKSKTTAQNKPKNKYKIFAFFCLNPDINKAIKLNKEITKKALYLVTIPTNKNAPTVNVSVTVNLEVIA